MALCGSAHLQLRGWRKEEFGMNDKLWPDLKTPVGFAPHLLEPRSGMTGTTGSDAAARGSPGLEPGTTVAFIGSGSSAALGYPTWNGLALELVKWTINVLKERPGSKNHLERCESLQARCNPSLARGRPFFAQLR